MSFKMEKSPLGNLAKKVQEEFSDTLWVGSFHEFIKQVEKNPEVYLRTSFKYLYDMINFFGKGEFEDCGEKLTRYELFDDPFDYGVHTVFGLERTLMKLVAEIRGLAENNTDERILILHGPVATAKDTILNLMYKGLEGYSKTKEGALFTFSWVFSGDAVSSDLGFQINPKNEEETSYAHKPEEHILAEVNCQLRDNPLFLIPKKYRKEYLEELIGKSGKKIAIPKKIIEGELCFNCQSIITHLLKKYNGDLEKSLNHVKVKRLTLSENEQRGIVTVDSAANPEGSAPTIIWDSKEYGPLENILRGIELHKYTGKWAKANRGIINYNEIFKQSPQFLQSLARAVQEFKVDFNGIEGSADCIIIGTTNQYEYEAFKDSEFNNNLKDRMRVTDVNYLLKANAEKLLYKRELKNAGYSEEKKEGEEGFHITPHALDLLAYWCVMTRMKRIKTTEIMKSFTDPGLLAALGLIYENMLLKAKFYNGEKLEGEEFISFNYNKELQTQLRNEHRDEGAEGISFRCVQNFLSDIISAKRSDKEEMHSCLSPMDMLAKIEEIIIESEDYEFLQGYEKEEKNMRQSGEAKIEIAEKNLNKIREEYHNHITREVKLAILGVDDGMIKKKVEEYLKHVTAYIFKEKMENPITKILEEPSEEKMKWVEDKIKVNQSAKSTYRQNLINKIASIRIKNDSEETQAKQEDYLDVIHNDLKERIKNGLYEEKKGGFGVSFEQLESFFWKHGTKQFDKLDSNYQQIVHDIIGYMKKEFNYCDKCAKKTVLYALSESLLK